MGGVNSRPSTNKIQKTKVARKVKSVSSVLHTVMIPGKTRSGSAVAPEPLSSSTLNPSSSTGNQTSRLTGESLRNIFCKTSSNGISGGNNTYSSAETSSTPEINQASVVDMDSMVLKENKNMIQERDSGINGCDDSSDSDDQESCEYLEEGEFEAGQSELKQQLATSKVLKLERLMAKYSSEPRYVNVRYSRRKSPYLATIPEETEADLEEYDKDIFPSETNNSAAARAARQGRL